jgi:ABC-type multidrug transport system ATPase subunit
LTPLVYSATRALSGGEKRRVSIAQELVIQPSIIFLDEPTSGLDAYNAFNVVKCLKTLANEQGRTIVMSIHQPRSNIFQLIDQLVLLSHGTCIYSGPTDQLIQHFKDGGWACPYGVNVADFISIDLLLLPSCNNKLIS